MSEECPGRGAGEPEAAPAWGGLDAEVLRRLRLGEGRPEDHFLAGSAPMAVVVPVRQYSRWRGGPTAFGPVGRVVATLLTLAVAWSLVTPLSVVPLVPLVFVVLRGIWHRELQRLPVLRDQRPRGRTDQDPSTAWPR